MVEGNVEGPVYTGLAPTSRKVMVSSPDIPKINI